MSFWPGHANVGGLVVNGVDVHFIAMGQLVPLASGGKGDTGKYHAVHYAGYALNNCQGAIGTFGLGRQR